LAVRRIPVGRAPRAHASLAPDSSQRALQGAASLADASPIPSTNTAEKPGDEHRCSAHRGRWTASSAAASGQREPAGYLFFLAFLTRSSGDCFSVFSVAVPGGADFCAISSNIFCACCLANSTDTPPLLENSSRSRLALVKSPLRKYACPRWN